MRMVICSTNIGTLRITTLRCQVCRVCQNYAKHFCSQCRKIAYCSPACQKSHWKAHKPMCLVTRLRNPVDETEVLKTISLEDKDNEEFISQTTNYDEMCGYGRTYPNVQSMITDWLRLCTFRIVISYGAPGNDRVLDVARAAGGVFVLNFKYILTEGGRDVKPRKQKQVLPSRIEDVESYIVQEIETLAMKSPNTCILIESGMRDHPNDAIEAGEMPVNTVVRSAQASWEASRGWEVFQHEPERLRKFELSRYGTLHVQQRTYMW
ncbi:hypothetical protein BD410DRAFT_195364 [Rickenella mellea]|uniref:MYND-type domain-containing protein n=1 Tax=Rickenella mellea TaxID=50990 RepID=A0A4Y7Q5P3_9AGAM|nr:hypothetical protein BD410DRAFT_195364 [Rickenella mellea]